MLSLNQLPAESYTCQYTGDRMLTYHFEQYEFVLNANSGMLLAFEMIFCEEKADFVKNPDVTTTLFHPDAVAWLEKEMEIAYLCDSKGKEIEWYAWNDN